MILRQHPVFQAHIFFQKKTKPENRSTADPTHPPQWKIPLFFVLTPSLIHQSVIIPLYGLRFRISGLSYLQFQLHHKQNRQVESLKGKKFNSFWRFKHFSPQTFFMEQYNKPLRINYYASLVAPGVIAHCKQHHTAYKAVKANFDSLNENCRSHPNNNSCARIIIRQKYF